MANIVDNVCCIDIKEIIYAASKDFGKYIKKKGNDQVSELSLIVERIINDLVTRVTHWAENDVHIDTDKYLPTFDTTVVTVDEYEVIFDGINKIIDRLDKEIDNLCMFPTWGYPTVKIMDGNVVIVVTGDYRIDDWMRQHQKRLLRKHNDVYKIIAVVEE